MHYIECCCYLLIPLFMCVFLYTYMQVSLGVSQSWPLVAGAADPQAAPDTAVTDTRLRRREQPQGQSTLCVHRVPALAKHLLVHCVVLDNDKHQNPFKLLLHECTGTHNSMSVCRIKTTFTTWILIAQCHVQHASIIIYMHYRHAYMRLWDLYMHVQQKQNNMLDMHITFRHACPKQTYISDMHFIIELHIHCCSVFWNACWTCNSHLDMQFDTQTCNMGSLIACWTCNSKSWNWWAPFFNDELSRIDWPCVQLTNSDLLGEGRNTGPIVDQL
jgi:hypothetical protein